MASRFSSLCLCQSLGGGGAGLPQLPQLPDTWDFTAVEEHAFPLGFVWSLAVTLRKRGSIIEDSFLSEK